MDLLWLFPLVVVVSALAVSVWAARTLRLEAAGVGRAAEELSAVRSRLDGLVEAAARLADSGPAPTRR